MPKENQKYRYLELIEGPGNTYRMQILNKADYPIIELIICSEIGTGAHEAASLMIGALEARNDDKAEATCLIGSGLQILRKMFRKKRI